MSLDKLETYLESRLEEPNQERFNWERSTLLQSGVQRWVFHDNFDAHVMVEHEGEDGEAGVDGRVAEDQHAIIYGYCDEVEHAWEDSLNDRNNQTSVNYELSKDSWTFVAESTVPKDQSSKLFELIDWKVCSKRGLHAFFSNNTNADVGLKNHSYIVTTIADRASTFSSELANFSRDNGFLSGAASTDAHGWS